MFERISRQAPRQVIVAWLHYAWFEPCDLVRAPGLHDGTSQWVYGRHDLRGSLLGRAYYVARSSEKLLEVVFVVGLQLVGPDGQVEALGTQPFWHQVGRILCKR